MATFYIDEKITIWQRHTFGPDITKEQVLEHIKNGGDFADLLGDGESGIIFETQEAITPADNGGCSTIELWEDGELLYKNGES